MSDLRSSLYQSKRAIPSKSLSILYHWSADRSHRHRLSMAATNSDGPERSTPEAVN